MRLDKFDQGEEAVSVPELESVSVPAVTGVSGRLTPLRSLRSKTASVAPEVGTAADCLPILFDILAVKRRRDVQEGERTVADGGEDGGGGREEEGHQLRPGAGDAQKVKTPVKL